MVKIKYKSKLDNEIIENAIFPFNVDTLDEKSLMFSIVDIYDLDNEETVISQQLRILIKDSNYGTEELFIDMNVEDAKDVLKIFQKMTRQIGSFKSVKE